MLPYFQFVCDVGELRTAEFIYAGFWLPKEERPAPCTLMLKDVLEVEKSEVACCLVVQQVPAMKIFESEAAPVDLTNESEHLLPV